MLFPAGVKVYLLNLPLISVTALGFSLQWISWLTRWFNIHSEQVVMYGSPISSKLWVCVFGIFVWPTDITLEAWRSTALGSLRLTEWLCIFQLTSFFPPKQFDCNANRSHADERKQNGMLSCSPIFWRVFTRKINENPPLNVCAVDPQPSSPLLLILKRS